jgi:hypothetical protein
MAPHCLGRATVLPDDQWRLLSSCRTPGDAGYGREFSNRRVPESAGYVHYVTWTICGLRLLDSPQVDQALGRHR